MNVIIENIFESASSTQVCFQVDDGPQCCLNPGQKTGPSGSCPTPEISKGECVKIWAVDAGITPSSNHFQWGESSADFTITTQKSSSENKWILTNPIEGQTDVHVKMGPDGQ